jgi:hypothetical protein
MQQKAVMQLSHLVSYQLKLLFSFLDYPCDVPKLWVGAPVEKSVDKFQSFRLSWRIVHHTAAR